MWEPTARARSKMPPVAAILGDPGLRRQGGAAGQPRRSARCRRTARPCTLRADRLASAAELTAPEPVELRLLQRLVDTTTQQFGYDPFTAG